MSSPLGLTFYLDFKTVFKWGFDRNWITMYLKAKELIRHLIMFSGFPQMRPRSVQTGSRSIERLTRASSCAAVGVSLTRVFNSAACSEPWNLKDKQHPDVPAEPSEHGEWSASVCLPLLQGQQNRSHLCWAALPSWLLISPGIREGLSRAMNMWAAEMEWTHMQISFDSLPFIKLKCFWERIRSCRAWESEEVTLGWQCLCPCCLSVCLSIVDNKM